MQDFIKRADVGFDEEVEIGLFAEDVEVFGIAVREEFGDGAAEVVQEAFREVLRFDIAARQDGKERDDVILAITAEFRREVVRPVLGADFITIDKRAFQSGLIAIRTARTMNAPACWMKILIG